MRKLSKLNLALLIIIIIIVADQVLKFWIKTHMVLGQEFRVAGNWFIIHFVENNGIALALSLPANTERSFSLFSASWPQRSSGGTF